MIGKVTRGTRVGGLLRYLYGPGKANEHTDPHLVAAWDAGVAEPVDLGAGRWDVRTLAALLEAPVRALGDHVDGRPVWHCSLRAAPGDRRLSDAEWAHVAREALAATGFARPGDDAGCRYIVVRHADDHVHVVATLARQDGTRPKVWRDYPAVRSVCRAAEARLGLTGTAPADRTAASRPARAETEKAARRGAVEVPRQQLQRQVRAAAVGATSEGDFMARLRSTGLVVRLRHGQAGDVTGYAVGVPGDTTGDGTQVLHGGGKLASDLSLPRLRQRWGDRRTGASDELVVPGPAATTASSVDAAARRGAHAAARTTGALQGHGVDEDAAAATGDLLAALAKAVEGRRPGQWGHVTELYDRSARSPWAATPTRSHAGSDLREAAHLLARAGRATRADGRAVGELVAALVVLAAAVAEMRARQDRQHQAAAARQASERARDLSAQVLIRLPAGAGPTATPIAATVRPPAAPNPTPRR